MQKEGTRGKRLNVASFFSGCGGFDLGFEKAGFNIVLANDFWLPAANTFKNNFPNTEFLLKNIKDITKNQLMEVLKKKNVDKMNVVIGGPPCQCFTRLNNNNLRRDDERNHLFKDYLKMIEFLKPEFVVMENVADLLVRKDTKGRYFKDLILDSFKEIGYSISFKVFETEKYGVPQKRRRVIFLATNKDLELSFPKESNNIATSGEFLKKLKNKKNLKNHEITENGPDMLNRIRHIPLGGYYESLPENLKVKKVRQGKLVTVKRYGSYLRRIKNDKPAITITTNYIIHPDEDRFLTNREKAVLHTFPQNFIFWGGRGSVSQQIANAVPPKLAEKIAKHILKTYY
jgi:DNA (cytosine-5)-methyltransferase 1